MDDTPYQNREIREMFNDVKLSLDRIETQTTRTNGRVSRLEGWREWITGGLAAFSLVLIPLFGWMVYKTATMETIVQTAVAQALIPYSE